MIDQLPRIGVVILNWRRPQDTRMCLASLQRVHEPLLDVIVVDNGSGDGSAAEIRQAFPAVTVVENGRNLGFAGGCNVGIRLALARGSQYVLLLNDDAELAEDTLQRLVAAAEADERIGMVGPTIYYAGTDRVVWSAGGAIDALGRSRHPWADGTLPGQLPPICDVDYVTGCVLLVKRAVIDQLGPLDERFFAYYEEAEWCARARRAGFRVGYVPEARAWHRISPTSRGQSSLYLYLMARNRLLFLRATDAPAYALAGAVVDILRTATSWSLRPRHRARRPFVRVLHQAVRDFVLGRFGPPPATLLAATNR